MKNSKIKPFVSLLALTLLFGCRTILPLPSGNSDYGNYEHQMVKEWEEIGKKYEAGEYQKALQEYQAFLDKYPYSRWGHMAKFFIGECQERLGQYDQARVAYREVMDKYPGSVWADLARDRMVQLP